LAVGSSSPHVKTYRNLFDQIASFENLLRAARKAQLGKRFKESTALFNLNLEKELLYIHKSLLDRTYRHGAYQDFFVFDPKMRLISAAPYRDRVVHHALCNVIEPIFERSFIHDSYACRKGKGSHDAVRRYTEFARKNRYVLKCDIQKYFQSWIGHACHADSYRLRSRLLTGVAFQRGEAGGAPWGLVEQQP